MRKRPHLKLARDIPLGPLPISTPFERGITLALGVHQADGTDQWGVAPHSVIFTDGGSGSRRHAEWAIKNSLRRLSIPFAELNLSTRRKPERLRSWALRRIIKSQKSLRWVSWRADVAEFASEHGQRSMLVMLGIGLVTALLAILDPGVLQALFQADATKAAETGVAQTAVVVKLVIVATIGWTLKEVISLVGKQFAEGLAQLLSPKLTSELDADAMETRLRRITKSARNVRPIAIVATGLDVSPPDHLPYAIELLGELAAAGCVVFAAADDAALVAILDARLPTEARARINYGRQRLGSIFSVAIRMPAPEWISSDTTIRVSDEDDLKESLEWIGATRHDVERAVVAINELCGPRGPGDFLGSWVHSLFYAGLLGDQGETKCRIITAFCFATVVFPRAIDAAHGRIPADALGPSELALAEILASDKECLEQLVEAASSSLTGLSTAPSRSKGRRAVSNEASDGQPVRFIVPGP